MKSVYAVLNCVSFWWFASLVWTDNKLIISPYVHLCFTMCGTMQTACFGLLVDQSSCLKKERVYRIC